MGSVIWEVDWGNDGFGRPNVLFATQPEKRRMLGMKMLGLLVLAAIVGLLGPPVLATGQSLWFIDNNVLGAGGMAAFTIAIGIVALIAFVVTGKFFAGDHRGTWRHHQVLDKMKSMFMMMFAGRLVRFRDFADLFTPARRFRLKLGAA